MLTKKSFIVGLAVVAALVCIGTVSTFAASVKVSEIPPTDQYSQVGIGAIPPLDNGQVLLNSEDVSKYLQTHPYVGGTTPNGQMPAVETVEQTTVSSLYDAKQIQIPDMPANEPVYYASLTGPFTPITNTPDLSGLLPGLNNVLPDLNQGGVLRNAPTQALMPSGYEVFDAHTGNLIAWG